MEELHSLLCRQLKKYIGGAKNYPPELEQFIMAVNGAYKDHDFHIHMLEHAMDLSSSELFEANSELRSSAERLKKQHSVLIDLTHSRAIFDNDVFNTIRHLTESVAQTLDVPRVSIWSYNKDRSQLLCVDIYDQSNNIHSGGKISLDTIIGISKQKGCAIDPESDASECSLSAPVLKCSKMAGLKMSHP